MSEERWPALPYEAWKDTYATLHMWTQIVGKVALVLAPPLNHCWAIALHVTSRGLATRPLPHSGRFFTLEFDFISHRLFIRTSDGVERAMRLEARSVADFYRELMATLDGMALSVKIWSMPVEIPAPIRFEDDSVHASYDPVFAQRFWRVVAQMDELFTEARCGFVGKCSPTNFFWGTFFWENCAPALWSRVRSRRLFARSHQPWVLAGQWCAAGAGPVRLRGAGPGRLQGCEGESGCGVLPHGAR